MQQLQTPQHRNINVFPRFGKRQKPVYYYRLIGPDGIRLGEFSTGFNTEREALMEVGRREGAGELYPIKAGGTTFAKVPMFEEYFADWFDWPSGEEPRCPYIKKKFLTGKTYSRSNAKNQRRTLNNVLIPAFGKRRITQITLPMVEDWLYTFPEKNGVKPATANGHFRTIRLMMSHALKRRVIMSNPCAGIALLDAKPEKRDIPRWNEIDRLFDHRTEAEVWGIKGSMEATATMLSACTGMRNSEIRAIRWRQVHTDHIVVDTALETHELDEKKPKNNTARIVPITPKLYQRLKYLDRGDGGYLFTLDDDKPVGASYFLDHYRKALEKIGVTEDQWKGRNMVFHGFRYFCNTVLQVHGVADVKVRQIIGHMTPDMTAHYTNVPIEEYATEQNLTIPEVQDRILRKAK